MCICQRHHLYCFLAISPTPNTYLYLLLLLLVKKITLKKAISFRLRDEAYMWTQLRREETLVVLPLVFPLSWYMVLSCKAYLSGSCL